MKEDFLHYVWKFRQYESRDLRTVEGMKIDVLDPGIHNENAGPDFLNARLRIGDTLWAGNVEIHIRSSDWIKHGHLKDRAYDNVILHVVYSCDRQIVQGDTLIPSLELKNLIDYQSYRKYRSYLANPDFIPCEKLVRDVPEAKKLSAIHSAAVKRLSDKSGDCRRLLKETAGDLEETFYRVFMKALGMKVNGLPFEQLSKIAPFSLVRKVASTHLAVEALLLGQAGFLEKVDKRESHIVALTREYDFLQSKFNLEPMPVSAWKLFRLRPQNFPQVRIAEAATFFHQKRRVVDGILNTRSIEGMYELLGSSPEGDFWLRHYTLEAETSPIKKSFGKAFLKHLVINAVVPFVFALADFNKDDSYRNLALDWLEQLSPEKNSIIRKFDMIGFHSHSALDTQGLLELKKHRCDQKKCLNCQIGIHLIRSHAKIS